GARDRAARGSDPRPRPLLAHVAMLDGCVPFPDTVAERYRREGYWTDETLADLIRPRRDAELGRTALVTRDEAWTYEQLDTRADRLAAGLRAFGIRPLDRVVVQLPNIPDFAVVSLALFRLGALPV